MKISVSRTLLATDEAAWGWIEMLQFGDRSPFALRLPKEGLWMLKTLVLEPRAASIVMFNHAGDFPPLQYKLKLSTWRWKRIKKLTCSAWAWKTELGRPGKLHNSHCTSLRLIWGTGRREKLDAVTILFFISYSNDPISSLSVPAQVPENSLQSCDVQFGVLDKEENQQACDGLLVQYLLSLPSNNKNLLLSTKSSSEQENPYTLWGKSRLFASCQCFQV